MERARGTTRIQLRPIFGSLGLLLAGACHDGTSGHPGGPGDTGTGAGGETGAGGSDGAGGRVGDCPPRTTPPDSCGLTPDTWLTVASFLECCNEGPCTDQTGDRSPEETNARFTSLFLTSGVVNTVACTASSAYEDPAYRSSAMLRAWGSSFCATGNYWFKGVGFLSHGQRSCRYALSGTIGPRPPPCEDLTQNGVETGIDCGGRRPGSAEGCEPCPFAQGCLVNEDCASGFCAFSSCQPSCLDDGAVFGACPADASVSGPCICP